MSNPPTLFARRLRDWRAGHGKHGRLTQEELAELLGISVDAIGKYERSLSFIRGDLEHRLAERLGWSAEDILACRRDWEGRRRATGDVYRLLDDTVLDDVFGGSWHRAAAASLTLAAEEFTDVPEAFAPSTERFLEFYENFTDHWGAVLHGDRMVAKWSLPFLLPEDAEAFRAGRFVESSLAIERFRRAILPGNYLGYCPALIVMRGHEAASPLLLRSFVGFLERLARRDVLLEAMATVSVSPGGAQVCRDLGMTWLCSHAEFPEYGMWELPGRALPGSIFGRRSPYLRDVYSKVFGGETLRT